MKLPTGLGCAALCFGLIAGPATARAQGTDGTISIAEAMDPEANVIRYDLSGPRIGVTLSPDGTARSQFGWHIERQAAATRKGPWFIVETVLLAGGLEVQRFVPNGTMIFGLRLPSGFEFGVGPSITLGSAGGGLTRTGIVIAAGQTFRFGGINVPVNVALAPQRDGARVTIVTGWAIRQTNVTAL